MAKIIYNETFCKISAIDELNCIVIEWLGYANSEQFRAACNFATTAMFERKWSTMLANNSKAKVLSADDQSWFNEQWFPAAYKKGFRLSAIVLSQNIFNQMAVNHVVNNIVNGDFEAHFFKDVDGALFFLKQRNGII